MNEKPRRKQRGIKKAQEPLTLRGKPQRMDHPRKGLTTREIKEADADCSVSPFYFLGDFLLLLVWQSALSAAVFDFVPVLPLFNVFYALLAAFCTATFAFDIINLLSICK